MRTFAAVTIVCSLALAGTAAAVQPGSETKRPPALRLVKQEPLVVRGVRFRSGERVRLRAASGDQAGTGIARAGRAGTFLETFDAAYDRCSGLLVTAIGNEGSRARLKLAEVYCPPAP